MTLLRNKFTVTAFVCITKKLTCTSIHKTLIRRHDLHTLPPIGCLMAVTKTLHSSANAFITSLAVADLCVGLFIISSSYARNILSGYPSLRMLASFQYFLFYSTVCSLCIVTADRFFTLTLPLRYMTLTRHGAVFMN